MNSVRPQALRYMIYRDPWSRWQPLAAETSGRTCFAVELDPLYVDVAVRRWQAFTGKKAARLADGCFISNSIVAEVALHPVFVVAPTPT